MNDTDLNVHPVVLAGGSGTRLWPLSRADYPKQFLALDGGEHTLLQDTVRRVAGACTHAPTLVCSERHRFLVAEQLLDLGTRGAAIVLEPEARNTAPAIAAAAWHVMAGDEDAVMLVMPADHLIPDHAAFREAIAVAADAARGGHLVTLGIQPTRPETGYGYIAADPARDADGAARIVSRFIEKPDAETAASLIAAGDVYWNAGIFVFTAKTFLATLAELAPGIHEGTREAVAGAEADLDFIRLAAEPFARCENISVDYAVMERASNTVVLPFAASWSDIGSWDAVHEATPADENGNAVVGDVVHEQCENTYLRSESKLVTAFGLKNVCVIETQDAVLVADMSTSQGIKALVEKLRELERKELVEHRTCYRPWGHYDSLNMGARFQVKRITVKPGAKLSLQKHFHRSEHWVVVHGTAIVTNGEKDILLSENESTYIPLGTMHRMHNPGSVPLELIEVQVGSYLGEDDIVRVGDEYGRS